MNIRVLGIMVHQVNNLQRYEPFVSIALEEGFASVIVYTPDDVDLNHPVIHGYTYQFGRWIKQECPYPSISHDIGYYTDTETLRKVKAIKAHPKLPFLGYGLGNKWNIHKHLFKSPQLKPYLLPTVPAINTNTVMRMLKKYRSIMLKPLNGSRGKGIMKLSFDAHGFTLEENEKVLQRFSGAEFGPILSSILLKERFLVQKWVDIRDHHGSVYDIRVLMQKNGSGHWVLTGMGIRQGSQEKITSNLTGGGQAFPVLPFLKEQFSPSAAKELHSKLEHISYLIPGYLERSYGKRLVELGLDIAIDRNSDIWIIEVNIKPGRTLWRKISDMEADRISLRHPIQYARYLLDKEKKGAY